MVRHLLLIVLTWCLALPAVAAVFDATSADFGPSYLSTSASSDGSPWRIWNDQAGGAPVVGAFAHQAGPLVFTGSSQGLYIQAAGVARDNPGFAVLGTSLDMVLARATDDQGIYVVARGPGDLLATPALLVPAAPTVSMSWTADPWGPDYLAHPGQTLTYTVLSLTATAPRSGLPGCLQIRETNSYDNQRRIFYWQVGTPWPVEVQDDRSLDAGTTLTWTATPVADLVAPAAPAGVWIRQGGSLGSGEYRVVAFFPNGTWGRFQRLAAQGGTSLWQIGTWRVTGPGIIETTVTYRVGNPTYLDALGSTTSGQAYSQAPTGTLTFNGETYDRAAQSGTDGAYWFGQDPDGFGVVADLDGIAATGDEPAAGLAVFAGSSYLYWQDDGTPTAGSEWGATANIVPLSGFDATVAGDENGPSGFATGAMAANFGPAGLLAPSILPGMGTGFRIAAAEFPVAYDGNGATGGSAPANQSKIQGVDLTLAANSGALVNAGFVFGGWNTAPDASGLGFAAGGAYAVDAPVLLYAVWTPIPTYAVTYLANGATTGTAPAGQTKTQGVDLVLTSATGGLGKAGSLFAGWNTANDGSGTPYAPGATYTLDAALTLHAAWTPVPGGGSPAFGFVDGANQRQVIAGDRVSLPVQVNPNLGAELLASVVITTPFAGLDAANGSWPTPAGTPTNIEDILGTKYLRLAAGATQQALVITIPSGASGTMTIAFGPDVQGLIGSGLSSSVTIRAASTTPMTGAAAEYVAGQNLSAFSVQAGDTITTQALAGTAASGPQDLNLVAVNGTPPYTASVVAGSAEIRPWKPFAAAVDWDNDGNADTGQWFTIVPLSSGAITIRIADSAAQTIDRTLTVAAGAGGSATIAVPASSAQDAVYTLAGAAGFGGVDALLARFQGAGANPLIRRGFVYGPRSKAWFELPNLPTEGKPLPWDGFYLADRTGDDLNIAVEALGVPPYIPLYPGWNVLALPPLRQSGGTVLPSITASDVDLYDEYGNTIARTAFDQVMGRPQTWNGSAFVELTTIAVGQGFFLKNNLSGANPRMLYLVPGRQALGAGVRSDGPTREPRARAASGGAEIIPATGILGTPPAPPASASPAQPAASKSGCGSGGGIGLLLLMSGMCLLRGRRRLHATRSSGS